MLTGSSDTDDLFHMVKRATDKLLTGWQQIVYTLTPELGSVAIMSPLPVSIFSAIRHMDVFNVLKVMCL